MLARDLVRLQYMCLRAPTCKTGHAAYIHTYVRMLYDDYLDNTSSAAFRAVPESIQPMAMNSELSKSGTLALNIPCQKTSLVSDEVHDYFRQFTCKRSRKCVVPTQLV